MEKSKDKNKSFSRITTAWRNFENLDLATLGSLRNFLFFAMIADIFGLYWFMEQKKLGMALMIVIFIILAFVLYLENKKGGKMVEDITKEHQEKTEEKKDEKKKPKSEDDEEDEQEGLMGDLGLGTPEEYQKRMEEAIGPGI